MEADSIGMLCLALLCPDTNSIQPTCIMMVGRSRFGSYQCIWRKMFYFGRFIPYEKCRKNCGCFSRAGLIDRLCTDHTGSTRKWIRFGFC